MELDNLKEVWKGLDDKQIPSVTNAEILSMVSKKSQSHIAKMKRNLFLELLLVIVLYGACIMYYFFAFEGKLTEISWFMLAMALFFIGYYYRKNKLLNEMQCVSCQVKSNLQRQVSTLEKYVRFYLITGTLLVPIAVIFFVWLIYDKMPVPRSPSILFLSDAYPLWQTFLVWFALLVVATGIIYLLNVWYVKKLYGNHVQKLKQLLNEMKDEV